MSESEDKAKILSAMGGVKGLIDSGLPALLFLICLLYTSDAADE